MAVDIMAESAPLMNVALNFFQSTGVVIAAAVAGYGLDTWRKQIVGKRRIEVAEETLTAFYSIRDSMRFIRSPISSSHEYQEREKKPGENVGTASLKDTYFVPLKRIQDHNEEFAKLQTLQRVCRAYFGEKVDQPFGDIFDARLTVLLAAQNLFQTAGQAPANGGVKEERQRWQGQIWFSGAIDDPILVKVENSVSRIENICQPELAH